LRHRNEKEEHNRNGKEQPESPPHCPKCPSRLLHERMIQEWAEKFQNGGTELVRILVSSELRMVRRRSDLRSASFGLAMEKAVRGG
jgi:peptide subunit release factor 1 (eRF1)